MSNATIMLAKNYTSEKDLQFPVFINEKLDGVPGDFYNEDGIIKCRTRQNKPILSVAHIIEALTGLLEPGTHIIGELYIEGSTFKDISGLVRKQETNDNTRELKLYVHDFYKEDHQATDYVTRMLFSEIVLKDVMVSSPLINDIPGHIAFNFRQFQIFTQTFAEQNPDAEGMIVRAMIGVDSCYKRGKRSKGLLRIKPPGNIDLPITGVEEAIDKHGKPKGMIGRINVLHPKFGIIGIGPGKLTHDERTDMYLHPENYTSKMIEILYMPDKSYQALREGRFHRWRPDRD